MLDRKSFINNIKKEIEKLEFQVEHNLIDRIFKYGLKAILKIAIGLDYAFPFILSAILYFNFIKTDLDSPFKIGVVEENASIETLTTSTGVQITSTSFDYNYSDESFEHNTGWYVNKYGLFERVVTTYKINDELDLNDKEKVFNLSKDEIEQFVSILDVKTIQKSFLEKEDEMYNDEMFIVVQNFEDEENIIRRDETTAENILETILYIIVSLSWGNTFRLTGKLFIKNKFRDKLHSIDNSIRPIDKKELNRLKNILEIKRENLMLLDDNKLSIDNSNFSLSLKK